MLEFFNDVMRQLLISNVVIIGTKGVLGQHELFIILTRLSRIRRRIRETASRTIFQFFRVTRWKMVIFRRVLRTFIRKRATRLIRRYFFQYPFPYL